jgi:hypothetical protein
MTARTTTRHVAQRQVVARLRREIGQVDRDFLRGEFVDPRNERPLEVDTGRDFVVAGDAEGGTHADVAGRDRANHAAEHEHRQHHDGDAEQ